MTDLLDSDDVKKIEDWKKKLAALQNIYSDFSQRITAYDREKDEEVRKDSVQKMIEIYDDFTDKYNLLGKNVGDDFKDLEAPLDHVYKYLKEIYEEAKKNGYFDFGEPSGKDERDEIRVEFELRKEKLGNEQLGVREAEKLKSLNQYVDLFKSSFGPGGVLNDLFSKIENRYKDFKRIRDEKSPDTPLKTPNSVFYTPISKTKEGKGTDFEPMPLPMKPEDKKEIEKIIEDPQMKSQIIDKIMKAFPTFKKDQLDALSVKDLLEISITLGFDLVN